VIGLRRACNAPSPAPIIQRITPIQWGAITMTARVASDKHDVQYYFEVDKENTPGGHDSGWIDTPTYTDVNLPPDTLFRYRVMARDLSVRLNETDWSDWVSARTLVPPERDPPLPNPMQFDPNGMPREVRLGPSDYNDFWIQMVAVTATDASPPVQYLFECSRAEFSSDWQASPTYSVQVGRWNTGFQWRVKARDAYNNETGWSAEVGTLRWTGGATPVNAGGTITGGTTTGGAAAPAGGATAPAGGAPAVGGGG
jgi:hypothetical protein